MSSIFWFPNVRHFLSDSDTFLSAAVVTREELATRMPRNTTESVIGRSVEGDASEQNTT